jgi:choline dehydrogenase-like flavoprotein
VTQLTKPSEIHDVIVIGSGAGGGTVTKVLADLGIRVLLLEAGPMLTMADLKEHVWPYQLPHRGAGAKGEGYPHSRRAHEPLRPSHAAFRRLRLHAAVA